MTLEEIVVKKLRQMPEDERLKWVVLIDPWIEQHRTTDTKDVRQATEAVQSTWGTLVLGQNTTRWITEDKELEYELG